MEIYIVTSMLLTDYYRLNVCNFILVYHKDVVVNANRRIVSYILGCLITYSIVGCDICSIELLTLSTCLGSKKWRDKELKGSEDGCITLHLVIK